jgi:CubicO group peptidase (beta-lactamase class C family)
MNFKVASLLALMVLLMGMAADAQTTSIGAKPSQQETPLRYSEPVGSIVSDLVSFIPDFMRQQNIPGVAIALIQDGDVVWTEGFGVANKLTRQPITPDTVFEVASNSKVITAYMALRLVDQGLLSLDEPLNAYLLEPWLPPSEYRDTITLRHVLSHSSGLGHGTTSRHNLFAPGRGYSYSAVGYSYLQAVIEEVTGQSLEEVAQEMVFSPLGMSSSSFVNPTELSRRTANGHLHAIVPALLFALLYLLSLLVVGLFGLVIVRIRTGLWRPTRRMAIGILVVAFVVSLLPAFILLGAAGLMEFAWLIAISGLILTAVFAAAFLVGRTIIVRLPSKRPGLQVAMTIVWAVFILTGLVFLTSNLTNLPVPKWPPTEAQAAGSMRATAGDMATFLIELSNPQYLNPETAAQLRTSQVSLDRGLS